MSAVVWLTSVGPRPKSMVEVRKLTLAPMDVLPEIRLPHWTSAETASHSKSRSSRVVARFEVSPKTLGCQLPHAHVSREPESEATWTRVPASKAISEYWALAPQRRGPAAGFMPVEAGFGDEDHGLPAPAPARPAESG